MRTATLILFVVATGLMSQISAQDYGSSAALDYESRIQDAESHAREAESKARDAESKFTDAEVNQINAESKATDAEFRAEQAESKQRLQSFRAEGDAIIAAQENRATHQADQSQKSAAELDERARKSARMSRADWEARKPQNNAFTNGTFQRDRTIRDMNVSQSPVPVAPEDPTMKSRIIAAQRYPQLGDPNSDLTKKYLEIVARLNAEGNPVLNQPNAAERVADMAAGELKIAPVK